MRLTRRTLLGTAAAGTAMGAPFVKRATAQTEITFGHVGEPGSLFDQSAQAFAERANAKLGDAGKVTVYGSSQLGSDSELMKKLKLGTVALALPSTVMSTAVAQFGLFEMPYLVRDRDHMKKINDEIVQPQLVPLAEDQGYKIIAIWENGFRHVTNNKRPIVKPEDLQGIKLRVPGGVWRVKMFEIYGANPSPMSFSEVFVALQTGVMDGQENPFAQIYPARFYEVQRFLSLTGHVYTPAYVTAGRSWSRFSPDVQQALTEAAIESQDDVYTLAAQLDTDLLDKLKAEGMEVNEVDKDAFVAASKPVYDAFAAEVENGGELTQRALALAEAS
jgi:TRAP-type transport system periplasmic protein